MNKKVLWITQTAIVIALLVVLQAVTAPLGNTIITGSLVNLMLIIGVMIGGLASGLTIALISPSFAMLFGIGPPFGLLIPFITLGNIVLVFCWHFLGKKHFAAPIVVSVSAAVVAAVAKFATLYLGVVKVAVPLFLKLPAPQATKISAMFSLPQLLTALIGGGLAILILPVLKKALVKEGQSKQTVF